MDGRRAAGQALLSDSPHVVRVFIPWTDFDHLLDTAFEQIRHYTVSDIAVSCVFASLRDHATTTDDERMRERLVLRGRRIVAAVRRGLTRAISSG